MNSINTWAGPQKSENKKITPQKNPKWFFQIKFGWVNFPKFLALRAKRVVCQLDPPKRGWLRLLAAPPPRGVLMRQGCDEVGAVCWTATPGRRLQNPNERDVRFPKDPCSFEASSSL